MMGKTKKRERRENNRESQRERKKGQTDINGNSGSE